MRRTSSAPYCFLETVRPVLHEILDSNYRKRKVRTRYRFENWNIASSLEELILAYKSEIQRNKWKFDAKEGTVNGLKMRLVRSKRFNDDQFTKKELNPPKGYGYWEVLPEKRQVRLLSVSGWDQEAVDKGTERGRLIAAYPRYLAPILRPLPKDWKLVEPFRGYIEGTNRSDALSIESAEYYLRAFGNGHEDNGVGEAFSVPQTTECFSMLFRRRAPRASKDLKFREVASYRVTDSAKALYRLMHWSPGLNVKACDFYKGSLYSLFHPSGRFFINIGFWKYEMSLTLYVAADDCEILKQQTGPIVVRCGVPGAHNGEIRAPKKARQFFRLFKKVIGRKTMIYSGNNFEV